MSTTTHSFKRIAIDTGGGDAPGVNAVIHGVVHAAHTLGWEIHGICDEFDGLLHPEDCPDGGVKKLTRPLVRDLQKKGLRVIGVPNPPRLLFLVDGTPGLGPNSLGTVRNERNEPVALVAVS